MSKKILFAFFLLLAYSTASAQTYRTEPQSQDIHTVQVLLNNEWNSYPIINKNSADIIYLSFDWLPSETDNYGRLYYRLIHCNADWTKNNNISEVEYLNGFNENPINNYQESFNTSVPYTHFTLTFPNEDVQMRVAGNYAVEVYAEENPDETLLTACFSVLDSQVNISGSVSSITDIDANKEHQQLSLDVNYKLNLRDVKNDLKVYVRQNNRLDNERKELVPNYILPSVIRFSHHKDLIFEAGNEFHRFDISSYRSNGKNVAHIEYKRPHYHLFLVPNRVNTGSYSYDQDQNGRFIIRTTDVDNADTQGDYCFVNLTLHADEKLENDIYVNGNFSNNRFSKPYTMTYDEENSEYYLTLFLKQGIYNFQYLTLGEGNEVYSSKKIDGNFYESENEYSISIYYRYQGQKYDSLVGFSTIHSRNK